MSSVREPPGSPASGIAGGPVRTERDLVGDSPAMQAVRRLVRSFAPYDTPLLLQGEDSTGKRLAAEVIHNLSPARSGPFVAVDCAALVDMMLAIELFGCEPGLFGGAPDGLVGRLEEAHGGTLLLERIERMPGWVQGRLLQVLERRAVERLGGFRLREVRVRLLASTTAVEPDRQARQGHTRLRDHLSGGMPLRLPPLRERGRDIGLLARHFLKRAGGDLGKPLEGFSRPALACLERHPWLGNLRELDEVVRAAAHAADRIVTPEHLWIGAMADAEAPHRVRTQP